MGDGKDFRCLECEGNTGRAFIFSRKDHLTRHNKNVHSPPYTCDVCPDGKTVFGDRFSLVEHMREDHTGLSYFLHPLPSYPHPQARRARVHVLKRMTRLDGFQNDNFHRFIRGADGPLAAGLGRDWGAERRLSGPNLFPAILFTSLSQRRDRRDLTNVPS